MSRRGRPHDQKDTLPIIPWYRRDWLASKARAVMTPLARGIYRELLDAHWGEEDCSLPPDDAILAGLAGVTLKVWLKVRAEVIPFLPSLSNGRLRNPRTYFEWSKARGFREIARERAKKGAAAKWSSKHAQSTPEAMLVDASPTPSPYPPPTPTNGIDPTGDATRAGSPVPPAPAPPATLRPGVDFDPASPLETAVADRCAELASLVARRQGRTPTAKDVRDVLEAVSATRNGKVLDSLVHASNAWLETTLRACDTFERENLDAGGDELDLIDLEEAHAPPPENLEPIHPGRGKS
jgi:uncharacterized protein YdaU (DUF1376 family)